MSYKMSYILLFPGLERGTVQKKMPLAGAT